MKYKLLSNNTTMYEADDLRDIYNFIEARTWLVFDFAKNENGNIIPLDYDISIETSGMNVTFIENLGFDTKLIVAETFDIDSAMVLLVLKDSSQIPAIKNACSTSKFRQSWSGEGVPFLTSVLDERIRYNYTIVEDGNIYTQWEVKITVK